MERCRREIAAIEAPIRAGHGDLQGRCLELADWSGELRRLLAVQTKKSRRGGTPAADSEQCGGDYAFTE
jgi:hypothetical protein